MHNNASLGGPSSPGRGGAQGQTFARHGHATRACRRPGSPALGSAGVLRAAPDLASGSLLKMIGARRGGGAPPPRRAFLPKGADIVVERDLRRCVDRMHAVMGENLLSASSLEAMIRARVRELDNSFCNAAQILAQRARATPHSRCGQRPSDRGPALDPDAQNSGRPRTRPVRTRAEGRRLAA